MYALVVDKEYDFLSCERILEGVDDANRRYQLQRDYLCDLGAKLNSTSTGVISEQKWYSPSCIMHPPKPLLGRNGGWCAVHSASEYATTGGRCTTPRYVIFG